MDLAVVGAGAAAVCLLDCLARRAAEPGRLLVFEPSPHLWRGSPYQRDLDEVRVNLPPAMMSARHGDATHFADWLRAGPYTVEGYADALLGQSMPPRSVYGAYLEETAEAALPTFSSAPISYCVMMHLPRSGAGAPGRGGAHRHVLGERTGSDHHPGRVHRHVAGDPLDPRA